MSAPIVFTVPGQPVGKGRPSPVRWTKGEEEFLVKNYPAKGLKWCAVQLDKKESQIRDKASRMGIKQDRASEFFGEWQARAAESKKGKKRPAQSLVMKSLHAAGKLAKTEDQRRAISARVKKWYSENEHPRGALGLKHTKESRRTMSEKSIIGWGARTEEQLDAHSRRASINGSKSSPINREGASWKAGWREIGGVRKYYRSRWEANYARYLEWLKAKGEIISWLHEPETFWFDGIKRGCMSYLPDFKVTENDGSVAYHEVKGWMDDRSKTKIRRMAKYHPTVRLIVIDSNGYRNLAKTMKFIIDGWE